MDFVLFDGHSALAPLKSLVNWLAPAPPTNHDKPSHLDNTMLGFKLHRQANPIFLNRTETQPPVRASNQRPLKIVHILEADHVPSTAGRMVISGKMSDVCAELDRLVAKELALH